MRLINRSNKLVNVVILESYTGAVIEYFAASLRLDDIAVRRHTARQPDIAADHRAAAYSDASKDRCPGVDHNIIFDDRMARLTFDEGTSFIDGKAFCPERHGLIEPHAVPHNGGFRD